MQREAEAIWSAQAFNIWFGIIIVGTCSFAGLEALEKLSDLGCGDLDLLDALRRGTVDGGRGGGGGVAGWWWWWCRCPG